MPRPDPSAQLAARRRAIFAACKAAGLDDDERRAIVLQVTGCSSMSACTADQLAEILNHLNRGRAAGKSAYAGRRRVKPAPDRAALLSKIDALLAELHRVTGEVHTLKYADAIAKKNGWAENVDFCDPVGLLRVVGALARTLKYKEK